jgi:hypothetical protein
LRTSRIKNSFENLSKLIPPDAEWDMFIAVTQRLWTLAQMRLFLFLLTYNLFQNLILTAVGEFNLVGGKELLGVDAFLMI